MVRHRVNTSFSSFPNIFILALVYAPQVSSHSTSEAISVQHSRNKIFHCIVRNVIGSYNTKDTVIKEK